ncbi:alpha/beta hydrolase [Corynebacterium sp. 319]|uniref:alpha/beta hydrolase n=1 Tax=unclassified Corynebacterium TaxID=2624378 RepID=UPI00125CB83A|nr:MULTISPECIES: alpha/beta hydrolase [unclassified Corynebacterium]KAB1553477.1 alpha/beta hydrolase [Corynebacterium sp. 319]KAB3540779.1 alpha/beta hydrolase [Corynebacterium sp. 366]
MSFSSGDAFSNPVSDPVAGSSAGSSAGSATGAVPDAVAPRRLAPARSVTVSITARDGRRIAGTLDFPAHIGSVAKLPHANLPTAVVVHCFTCNRRAVGTSKISKTLARLGFLSLRIDMEGLGDSDGRMEDSTLTRQIADVCRAAEWLDEHSSTREDNPGRILVGHSLGGAAVLRAAPQVANVRAVATVGAPFNPSHVTSTMPKLEQRLREDSSIHAVEIPGRGVKLGRPLLDDLSTFDAAADAAQPSAQGIATLFIHPPSDDLVPYEHAEKLYAAAGQPKSLISIPEADHLLKKPGSGQRVGELIALWAQAYLG